MEDNNQQNDLMEQEGAALSYEDLVTMVTDFADQLQSLDYRVTNKNFGSKLYQTKETINSKSRFVAGAEDDVVIMDAQHPIYRLWAGAKDPSDAPFAVDKNGNMIATSITISGYVETGGALADIGAGNITSTYIGNDQITTPKIATGAVTANEISVSSLSAISGNIGTIIAGSITGVTITGGTVQTSSSSLRTVLGGGDDRIKFMNGATVYASIRPYVFASGNGMNAETNTGDAYWYIQEGSINEAAMGTGSYGIFIRPNDIQIYGDVTMNDDLEVDGTITLGGVSRSSWPSDGASTLSALSIDTTKNWGGYGISNIDNISFNGAGSYIESLSALYFQSRTSNPSSPEGSIWFYSSGGTVEIRTYIGGARYRFNLTSV